MEFIPTTEETGLIIPIGYWVLEETCRQTKIWQEKSPNDLPLTISINLSTRQCMQPDLVERMQKILTASNIKSGSLHLELTESLVVEASHALSNMLSELRDLDIQVQIDDFGSGYSSLSYLQNLTIDSLKIDCYFLQNK